MEIRLRCGDCDREVLVDEAFAGAVCRCPHCRATLAVPDRPAGRSGERPAQPAARVEPPPQDTPIVGRPATPKAGTHHLRRVVVLLMLGITSVFLVTAAIVLQRHFAESQPSPPKPRNPLETGQHSELQGPRMADVALAGRIAYVLDGGAGMRDVYDYAVAMTLLSIDTLDDDQQYTVIVAGEQAPRPMPGGYHTSGAEGEEFLMNTLPVGATDIAAALSEAAQMRPDVVVLMARKPLADGGAAVQALTDAGARLVTIAIEADEQVEASLAEAAAATDGESRSYTRGQIDRWLSGRL